MAKPITEKCSTQGGNNFIKYAASSMQGCPDAMEEFQTTILDLNRSNTSFFGVYDGHGDGHARYCSSQFHDELAKDGDYANNLQNAMTTVFSSIDVKLKQSDDWRMIAYPPGIRNLIRRLSIGGCTIKRWLWKEPYLGPLQEGCTTCMAVIRGNQITVGNIGDSRCVLSWKCEPPRNVQALDLSTQHKPDAKHEKQRILSKNADGGLKVGHPWHRGNTIHLQIVRSVKSSTQVIESVRKGLQSGKELKAICEELLDSCLAQGSKHNLSVIVVEFNLNQAPPLVQDPPHEGNGTQEVPPSHPTGASDGGVASDVGSQHVDVAQGSTATQTDDNKEGLEQEKKKSLGCFSVDRRRSGTGKAPRRHVKAFSSVWGLFKNGKCASTSATVSEQVHVPHQKDPSDQV